MPTVKKCEVTFKCPSCDQNVTIRSFSVKGVTCHGKGCTANFLLNADGTRFKSLKYSDWRKAIVRFLTPNEDGITISVDIENTEE